MSPGNASHQKLEQTGRSAGGDGEAFVATGRDEATLAGDGQEGSGRDGLLRQALSRGNMVTAWKRVKANKGSAGFAGLSIGQTQEYLKTCWPRIRSGNTVKIAVAPKALDTFKQRIRDITRRAGGKSMTQVAEQLREYLPG